jgi:glycine cleavage system transcriptional repressor
MENFLVLTAMGENRSGITNEITQLITQCGCNIVDSRIALFGQEFTLIMLLSGNNNAISRVESTLPLQAQQHALLTVMKRTSKHKTREFHHEIDFYIQAKNAIGLTQKFTQFLAQRNIDIKSLSAHTEENENTLEDDQFILQIRTQIPANCPLDPLLNDFSLLCQQLNAQGQMTLLDPSQGDLLC